MNIAVVETGGLAEYFIGLADALAAAGEELLEAIGVFGEFFGAVAAGDTAERNAGQLYSDYLRGNVRVTETKCGKAQTRALSAVKYIRHFGAGWCSG